MVYSPQAEVAELADAPALGAGGRKAVGVQVPSSANPFPSYSPILTAKTLFISNASGEVLLPAGTPDLTYNEFYAAMKNWGRYQIVSNPADADLVFEIRFMNIGLSQNFQFSVVALEPKSHVVLWAFSENVRQSGNAKTSRKYFDDALAALAADLMSPVK
jgi:hypothetical protein